MPKELERPAARTAGPDKFQTPSKKAFSDLYRRGTADASPRHTEIVHDRELADKVLHRAANEIRDRPRRLPLWAHRLGAWAGKGRLPYQRTWNVLFNAALDAGADEDWVRRSLFHGLAASNVDDIASPKLWELVNRGIE